MVTWVRTSESRPGYGGELPALVPKGIVDKWIMDLRIEGIRSVICLLHDDQLPMYAGLGVLLPAYYEAHGLAVAHVPSETTNNHRC